MTDCHLIGHNLSELILCFLLMYHVDLLAALQLNGTNNTKHCKQLNKFITCYEQIEFTNIHSFGFYISITFLAFGETITLVLQPAHEKVARSHYTSFQQHQVTDSKIQVTVIDENGPYTYYYQAKDYYYYGKVKQWPNSYVYGMYRNKTLRGTLHVDKEIYYVEPARKYFKNRTLKTDNIMVLYKTSAIRFWEQNTAHLGIKMFDIPLQFKKAANSSFQQNNRFKRSRYNVNICELNAVSDHTFYQNTGSNSELQTIDEIFIHVTEADRVFRLTDFNGDSFPDNIGFILKRLFIYKTEDAKNYLLKTVTTDSNQDLTLFSRYDHSGFCLGVLFTHRDYDKGIIGLAYKGSSSIYGLSGGICSKPFFNKKSGEHFYHNSLLLTSLNHGSVLPQRVVSATLAHEIGHSFGASHDKSEECVNHPNGKYLMHATSSDTNEPNNFKFSPCSIGNMNPVILNKRKLCFTIIQEKRCGNRMKEEGEQCDCGYEAECRLRDTCCNPAEIAGIGTGCTLKSGKMCSPVNSKCCDLACQVIRNPSFVCQSSTDCLEEATCDGRNADCPKSKQKPNKTLCNGGRKYCMNGECSRSICDLYDLKQCQCMSNEDSLCQLCCQKKNGDALSCRPFEDQKGNKIYLSPGQSCNNYTGFCTAAHACLVTDEVAVWDRLNSFFQETLPEIVNKIVIDFWYAALAFLLLSVLVIAAFVIRHKEVRLQRKSELDRIKNRELQKQANKEIDLLNDELAVVLNNFETGLIELSCHQQLYAITALARLKYLFPMASKREIVEILKISDNENHAMKYLLDRYSQMRCPF